MITFQYNAQTFQPSAPSPEEVKTAATLKALRESLLVAEKNGVETWQVRCLQYVYPCDCNFTRMASILNYLFL